MTRSQQLEQIDWLLIALGVALLCGWLIYYVYRRRDPLRPAPLRPNQLDWVTVLLAVSAWLLVAAAAVPLVQRVFGLSDDREGELIAATASTGVAHLATIPLCLLIAAKQFRGGLRGLGFGRRPVRLSLAWAGGGFLASWPLCAALLAVASRLIEWLAPTYPLETHGAIQALHQPDLSTTCVVWIYLVAAALTPLAEEIFFRGLLQTGLVSLLRWRWGGVLLTGLVFGCVHHTQLQAVLPLTAFGICLGYVYEKSGSLTAVVLMHAMFNVKTLLWDALLSG
ncbi:MAG TPA: CPBP family intramembrane glutamic endopeptidase [Phycisphaerae bacterium]|nr:CPBP family intramembrane glutamic endopeptidase [Phycisphaerae bacterium]